MATRLKPRDAGSEPPETFSDAELYERPGFLLRRAHQISVSIFLQECEELRLTPPQHSILFVLHRWPGLDQTTLARAIGFDRATVGETLGGMETRGLLRRAVSAQDKRRKVLFLTAKGRDVMTRAIAAIHHTSDRLLAPLSAERRELFIEMLTQITGELNDASRSPVRRPDRAD
ncbi:MAG: MarR family transcriptional regulator [Pantoea sp.]|uniref:MarR family winged helix-turn-helix transcriptional regulator n=1 Tax=Pantoea sp. TaxID=69393 RepID=UPI00239A191C|nr:MarR family transcriptional regulator [Pantoea sp.]MDE1186869.1 MarR family transcriptional regulator [Pantoea sp.]